MRALPPPEFVKIDPAAIEAALIARYEQKSGKTLYPAQVERLFIDQVAYAKSLALMAIQHAGEQLLVRFSGGVILEYLGELVATPRLLAQPARCTQSFTLAAPATAALLIDLGTRITSQDGRVVFATEQAATIPVGATQVSVPVVCESAGSLGNGWAIGQLATLVQPAAGLTTRNESVPVDGAEDEDDAAYKERIILAPEAYSNAGSRGAYRYHVRGVHQSIIDVAVLGPDDGQEDGSVALYPLTASGLPSAELLAQVQAAVSAEKVRPLCDRVSALAPAEVTYQIRAGLTLYSWAEATSAAVLAEAQAAAEAHAAYLRAALGRDIVPEQLVAALQVNGVYRAALELPSALSELAPHEWANCTAIELSIAGVSNG